MDNISLDEGFDKIIAMLDIRASNKRATAALDK
jgi:hypothetical protein